MKKFASAEVLFGSISRGDSDLHSDRDILIVDHDVEVLSHRTIALEVEGWSVASYTFKKLDALAQMGALFIQHLKDEGYILRDEFGRVRLALNAFTPKLSYRDDLIQNAQLASLVAMRPDTASGSLWAADVLYVATRNFGILYLAEQRKYVFSYSKILETLLENNVIPDAAFSHLLKLRWAKSLYRSGERVAADVATGIVRSALEMRPSPAFPKRSTALSPVEVLAKTTALPSTSPAYHKLRSLERGYVALRAINPTLLVPPPMARLLRWIENPRAYSSIAARLEDDLVREMQNAGMASINWLLRSA